MERLQENIIKTSVRNLVEFILRSGDIDNRHGGSEKEAMQAGSRIHRKIQRMMGGGYRAEVPLKEEINWEEEVVIRLEGRADGIFEEGGLSYIDEIKGVYFDPAHLAEPVLVHKGQAMCYGYIYAKQNGLAGIGIQMTYCNLETEEIRRFRETYSFEEIEDWFMQLIREYAKWAVFVWHKRQRRKATISRLEFPFPYRDGQRDLAVSVYRTISRGKTLFIQAPTGIGKTMSTVFPAVKAVGEGFADKIFYLTAKTITRTVAEEAFEILRQQGLVFCTVTITAKEKICPMDVMECNPEACPYAKGHFDRVNEAVFDIIHQVSTVTRDDILRFSEEHQVCPFEFSLDVTNWLDGIICDYNYVFDPNVYLKRFFGDTVSEDYLFLVDEAHNLVERAREMYSAQLFKEDFLAVKRFVKDKDARLARSLEQCNKALLEMKRECDTYQVLESASHMASLVNTAFSRMEDYMEDAKGGVSDEVLDFFFQLRHFLGIYERLDENYRIYTEHTEDGRFMLKLLCVNPAVNLRQCLDKGNSTVFFSATLLPINYYRSLLSGNPEDYAVYVESPFDSRRRLLCVGSDVSSRYTRRNQSEYEKVWEYIRAVAAARKGNYLVFLPSYSYMNRIYDMRPADAEFDVLIQTSGMTEQMREEFLDHFQTETERSLIGLCVIGGIFLEGIDLKRERLIGALVVGTGLPQICTEREILKSYFDEKEQKGFDFAYLYPGMNKVLQAAGRVIRTSEDTGVIALLDERFLRRDYLALFPREWQDYSRVTRASLPKALEEFWKGVTVLG